MFKIRRIFFLYFMFNLLLESHSLVRANAMQIAKMFRNALQGPFKSRRSRCYKLEHVVLTSACTAGALVLGKTDESPECALLGSATLTLKVKPSLMLRRSHLKRSTRHHRTICEWSEISFC
uniref:Putative secreted protein n=1 Tax=Ixodes ricinus TaxID=34613 RepID=A0A6B0UNG0_IXORI